MDKEEILAKSREENKDRDFVEEAVLSRANSVALGVGVILCSLLSVLHSVFRDSVDYGVWTVMFGITSAIMFVKFSKLHKRHELLLGLVYGTFSVFFFVFYLRDVLGVF